MYTLSIGNFRIFIPLWLGIRYLRYFQLNMWICRIWLPKGLHLIVPIVTELKNRNAFSGKKEGVYGHLSMSRVKSLIFIALVEKKNKIGQMLFEENYSLCSPPGSHVLAILFWRAGLCALWSKSSKYLRNNQYNNLNRS